MSAKSKNNILQCREDFPMLKQKMHGKPLVYLDSAATSLKPQPVIDAINNYYSQHYGTVHRAIYELAVFATLKYQTVREQVREFLNAAKKEEIIFTKGTTEAVNLVAYSFGKAFIKPGDEILISEMEHHSNIVPWQIACEDRGAILKVIPMNERGELLLDEFEKLLSPRTRLLAVGHISNAIGTINPIKTMAAMAHRHGAKIFVDGAQSAPHMPVDVQDLNVDFFAFSGHKIYGPTGVGVLYAKAEILEKMPPYQSGGDMIEKVTFEKTTYNDIPMKFEAGTPMIAEVIGLGAALDYIENTGWKAIQEQEEVLFSYATNKLRNIPGLRIIGTSPDKGALISFVVDGIHALDIGTLLDLRGIAIRTGHLCAQPALRHFGQTALARASFAFYNTLDEVDAFVDALNAVIKQLK